ncbi:hypothetical protein [Cellulomonas soli]|uniref:Uncharacterized protein n=1 Tax=Cellulomonas soli TaxID=931535 RepID=A0A512P9D3_9CELL|nr:hypothetical protein [Cellulomonas soli]NYI60289.1 hypothetical protein [Cellulomonas soli]GEP67800.1 hypothetical protein CSO01_05150 [Cellulomonas soli]
MTPSRPPAHRVARVLAGACLTLGALAVPAGAAFADDAGDQTGLSVSIPARAGTTPTPVPTTTTPSPTATSTTAPTAGRGAATTGSPRSAGTSEAVGGAQPAGAAAGCAPSEPDVPTRPATAGTAGVEAHVDQDLYLPGARVTATATGFAAGEQVQLVLFSEAALVGSFTADAAGQVQAIFPVADGTAPGTHTVQMSGWCGTAVAVVDVLVGSAGATAPAEQGVPPWAWWAGGGAGLVGLGAGGWQLLALMRGPGALAQVAVP